MAVRYSLLSRTRILVWLLLFILIPFSPLGAQKLFFDNYGVKQGLSGQKVNTLLQDSKDYIWLGTANGVSRFDGKKFENFSSRNGLAANGVKCIIEDSLGYIWFGHYNGGISRYDGQKFEKANFDSLMLTGDVTSIAQIKDKIWFASSKDGAILADFPVKEFKHIVAKQFKGGKDGMSPQVFGAIVNKAGEFICVSDIGTRKFVKEDNKFENYRMPHMTTYFSPVCLFDDSKGNIWFGTYNGGVYRYNTSENRMDFKDLIKEGMTSNWVSCFTEDSRGRIWMGTWGGGIGIFDGDSLTIFNETNGLKANKIHDILEDVEGNMLIADETNGLTIFKGDALITINEKESLPDPNVYAIYQDKSGAMWFGTNAGISRYFLWSGKEPVIYNQAKNSIFEEIRFFKEDKEIVLFRTKEELLEKIRYYLNNEKKRMEIAENSYKKVIN